MVSRIEKPDAGPEADNPAEQSSNTRSPATAKKRKDSAHKGCQSYSFDGFILLTSSVEQIVLSNVLKPRSLIGEITHRALRRARGPLLDFPLIESSFWEGGSSRQCPFPYHAMLTCLATSISFGNCISCKS